MRVLHRDIQGCTRCPLRRGCSQRVPGVGTRWASIMLFGEAPGYHEDRIGEPFVGKSGARLDRWLARTGLSRDDMFITNVLRCRPENNRFPEYERGGPADRCEKWTKAQLKLVKPRAVILCGRQALHHILLEGTTSYADPFAAWVGKIVRRRDLYGDTRFAVLFHPSYILRKENPIEEAKCLEALEEIRAYVASAQRAEAVPVIDLAEVRPARDLQHQQRFRLFKPSKETT